MHVDVYSGILENRPAAWMKAMLTGLLTMGESRLYRILHPVEPHESDTSDMDGGE